MDTENGWTIAIPDATVKDWSCRFYNGAGFSESARTSVFFTDRAEAERVVATLLDPAMQKLAYLRPTRRIVPPRVVEGSTKRIDRHIYGIEGASDIHLREVVHRSGQRLFEARVVVGCSPEDLLPQVDLFDPEIEDSRAFAMGEGDTPEEAIELMLRCLDTLSGHAHNEGEEWKG